MDAEADVEADPVNPMLVFRELSARLPLDAIVAADSGSSANWYARQLRFRGEMRGSLSGNLATMGPGVPYGIGAKFGDLDWPVIVFAGDGAMQMNGLADERACGAAATAMVLRTRAWSLALGAAAIGLGSRRSHEGLPSHRSGSPTTLLPPGLAREDDTNGRARHDGDPDSSSSPSGIATELELIAPAAGDWSDPSIPIACHPLRIPRARQRWIGLDLAGSDHPRLVVDLEERPGAESPRPRDQAGSPGVDAGSKPRAGLSLSGARRVSNVAESA